MLVLSFRRCMSAYGITTLNTLEVGVLFEAAMPALEAADCCSWCCITIIELQSKNCERLGLLRTNTLPCTSNTPPPCRHESCTKMETQNRHKSAEQTTQMRPQLTAASDCYQQQLLVPAAAAANAGHLCCFAAAMRRPESLLNSL